jgi:polyferredoxin
MQITLDLLIKRITILYHGFAKNLFQSNFILFFMLLFNATLIEFIVKFVHIGQLNFQNFIAELKI